MEGLEYYITALIFATLIPFFYMIAYVLKIKEKRILDFFKTLLGTIRIYAYLVAPMCIIVHMFRFEHDNNFIVAICIFSVLAIAFSVPYFKELFKCIVNDFDVSIEQSKKIGIFLTAIVLMLLFNFMI